MHRLASISRAVGAGTKHILAPRAAVQQTRNYNFASSAYAGCFGDLPSTESIAQIRKDTVTYIEQFDYAAWHSDPVTTVLKGDRLAGGVEVDTPDAFEKVVGRMVLATPEEVDAVIAHVQAYRNGDPNAASTDLRTQIRAVEEVMLTTHAAALVGNQAMDFHKQDGVTEIEESLEANEVERRMNDLLLADEQAGILTITRAPALVGCVSNFSNFLDLCRKVLRNLELGVPVVVLSRSNTTQHMYRWTQMLNEQLALHGVDAGMVTFAACDIEQQRRIMVAAEGSPLYLTGSRPVAAAIKEILPATFSSTGGPNTMVATELTEEVKQAVRWSVAIENSGQCTAMRHLVAPNCTTDSVDSMLHADGDADGNADVPMIDSSADSLRVAGFAGLFNEWGASFKAEEGYRQQSNGMPAAYKVNVDGEFPEGIDEHWRRVYLDVTSVESAEAMKDRAYISSLAKWLVEEQPITLGINGDVPEAGYPMASQLFEETAQVVYSVGHDGAPALTCQARPQEGEVFGEFAPRRDLTKYTKFPVIVPSATPSYNSHYTSTHLAERAAAAAPSGAAAPASFAPTAEVQGYLSIVQEYLGEAAKGPRDGHGARTALWGLQRPPLGQASTVLRLGADTTLDAAAMALYPFYLTNAWEQLRISVDPAFKSANCGCGEDPCATFGADGVGAPGFWQSDNFVSASDVETDAEFESRVTADEPWNVLRPTAEVEFSIVAHHISTLFPLGHIKSTQSNDTVFANHFSKSAKWLRTRDL